MNDNSEKVFLGGSCNPTTWRQDVAIPFLRQHSISFYNPQVSDWRPELMQLEEQAKQRADVLFFVIDSATRGTASMVEAAYLAGCGRQLILIMKNIEDSMIVGGEKLSKTELEDIERSHEFLKDFLERQGIPLFTDINTALQTTTSILNNKHSVCDTTLFEGTNGILLPTLRPTDEFEKVKDAFDSMDANNTGTISEKEMCLAYRAITDKDAPLNGTIPAKKQYTFEEFCKFVHKYETSRIDLCKKMASDILRLPKTLYEMFCGLPATGVPEIQTKQRDVFLGGTCGNSTWRQDLVIPILKQNGISYYNPQVRESEWSPRYIPLEAAVKDKCRLLLFIITDGTRGVGSMLEVGHYIGLGCSVVLCLQDITPNSPVRKEQLSETAIKDYNRARAYLGDLARRAGMPVFEDVEQATHHAVDFLQGNV